MQAINASLFRPSLYLSSLLLSLLAVHLRDLVFPPFPAISPFPPPRWPKHPVSEGRSTSERLHIIMIFPRRPDFLDLNVDWVFQPLDNGHVEAVAQTQKRPFNTPRVLSLTCFLSYLLFYHRHPPPIYASCIAAPSFVTSRAPRTYI